MDAPSRERKPDFFEIHEGFQQQGKRLQDCLSRLITISEKLVNEPPLLQEGKPVNPNPNMPGIVCDLNNDINGYRDCITNIEIQLSKIERSI